VQVTGVQADAGQGGGSSGGRTPASRSPAPAPAVAGQQAADPTDAPDASSAGAQADAGDLADSGVETLPFTGARLLPMVLVAALLVLAGIALRRSVRTRPSR
jgi:hypothetical protein